MASVCVGVAAYHPGGHLTVVLIMSYTHKKQGVGGGVGTTYICPCHLPYGVPLSHKICKIINFASIKNTKVKKINGKQRR